MEIGQRVKMKGFEEAGTIICIYALPEDYDLVDIEFDDGGLARGISTELIYGI